MHGRRQDQGEQRRGQHDRGDRHVPPGDEGENRQRRADGDRDLRQVLAEEGLKLLHAVDHRQHHAAGALRAEPGGAEGDDLVEQAAARRFLHARGGAVGDHGAVVVEPGAQQDRGGRGHQRQDPGFAAEHPGQERAKKGKARDAHRQRQQSERGGHGDAAAQAGGHAPKLQIEMHLAMLPHGTPHVDRRREARHARKYGPFQRPGDERR